MKTLLLVLGIVSLTLCQEMYNKVLIHMDSTGFTVTITGELGMSNTTIGGATYMCHDDKFIYVTTREGMPQMFLISNCSRILTSKQYAKTVYSKSAKTRKFHTKTRYEVR